MFPRFALPRINRRFQVAESPRIAKRTVVLCCLLVMLGFGPTQASAQAKPELAPDASATSVAAPSNSGSAQLTQQVEPGIVHIVPFGRNGSTGAVRAAIPIPAGTTLRYWGGPVISQVHVVAVFWGPNVNPAITAPGTIDQFFRDITVSRYYDLLTEYSTTGITGVGVPATSSNQSIQQGLFDGKFTITPSLCASATSTTPCSLTDLQIQQELARQINAGVLPTPVTDAQGNPNSFYMIYFPPFVTISIGTDRSCVTFCAYHSNTDTPVTPRLVPYGVLPDFAPPSGCSTGCGAGTLFENVTAVTSHELSEAVTDALAGSAQTTAPPLAWYDPDLVPGTTSQLGEIGDICVGLDTPVLAGANSYTVQAEFSNLQGECVIAPPNFNLNAPASAIPGIAFNLPLTIQGSAGTALTGYTGTVHFTSSDAAAILPADYPFTATDGGTHTFPITLNTLGDRTITVTDIRSGGFTGTVTLNVNVTPDLTIAESRSGGFVLGQSGTYTITVSNTGNGPTTANVSVVDSLPSGLTASSISGAGWTCSLTGISCNRADALARGASYPPITLNVSVAPNAPSVVTNFVTVSGGGETNTANDSFSDPSPISAPDLTISKSHTGAIFGDFFQGQTGATYTITVLNNGSAPTTAAVTVVDTLPASGLTATAIAGTGWTCTLANLSCTRSDVLASGSAYPPITVTVDVALNAPGNVTNTAAVSGGGETNTTNNIALDATVILPPPSPDLTVGLFEASRFIQGQSSSYTIAVGNGGTQATSGTVTVVDSLPAALTATSISGIGWACDLPSLTCTRSDTLPFSTNYPPITLSVNIAANAPASVTNTVTVSGGGDTNPRNNSASDATQIVPPLVDLSFFVAPSLPLLQGQVNAGSVDISLQNFGNTASAGAITVSAALPPGLSVSSISGPGWTCDANTVTCTTSTSVAPGTIGTGFVIDLNVSPAASGTLSINLTLSGGGDGNSVNNTTFVLVPIQPAVGITPVSGSQAVAAGQSALFDFLAFPQSTAGTLTFQCSGLPKGAACAFNPSSVNQLDTQVTMTVSTTARASTWFLPFRKPMLPAGPPVIACLIAFMFLVFARFRTRLKPALAVTGLVAVLMFAGCGGGGGSTPPPPVLQNPNGTPAGTYSITVTATGFANMSASQVFQLTVK